MWRRYAQMEGYTTCQVEAEMILDESSHDLIRQISNKSEGKVDNLQNDGNECG